MRSKQISLTSFIYTALIVLALPLNTIAQDEATSRRLQGVANAADSEVIINQVDTSKYPKVSIFTTVLKNGTPVSGLTDKDFTVKEDEVEQEPLSVAPKLDALNAVITLDTSGSIKKALPDVQNAAKLFLNQLAPEDKFQVVTFAREVKVLGNLGGKEEAKKAIDATVARGDTALYDAVYSSADTLKTIAGRKAIILLSDGVDDDGQGKQLSSHSLEEGLNLAVKLNIPIFTIGLGSGIDETVLKNVAETTGGKYFNVASADSLQQVYSAIGKQLGGQYGIFYTSNLPADGTKHRIALSHSGKVSVKEYMAPLSQTVAAATPQATVQVNKVSAQIEPIQKPGLHVSVIANEGGPLIEVGSIKVYQGDGVFESKKVIENAYSKNRASFKLAAGEYEVTAEKGAAQASAKVKMVEGEANNITINLNAGTINMVALANEGGPKLSGVKFSAKTISDGFSEAKVADSCYNEDKCNLLLNAGKYQVSAERGQAVVTADVNIEAGASLNQLLILNAGVIRIKTVLAEGASFINAASVKIYKDQDSFDGKVQIDSCYDSPMCTFTVSAGEYLISALKGQAITEKKVSVAPGGTADQVMVLNAGVISVKVVKGAGGPTVEARRIELSREKADGQTEVMDTEYNKETHSFTVNAGRYKITATKDDTPLSKEIDVTAGGKTEVELIF